MDTLVTVVQFLLSLSILVVLHEFGHFLPAKWFKCRVEKFYLFFNPYFALFKKQIGETEWGIGWLPLGGYVKISGMIDESMDKEQMLQEPQPWEFRSKKAWQRLIIMIGGVTINFILGILLFAMIFVVWGESFVPSKNVTAGIVVDSLGYDLGLRDGDKILKVGDKDFVKFNDGFVASEIIINDAKTITLNRNGKETVLNVDPQKGMNLGIRENQERSLFGPRIPFEIKEIPEDSPSIGSGLQAGDRMISMEGRDVSYFHLFRDVAADYKGKSVELMLTRNEKDTLILNTKLSNKGTLGLSVVVPESEARKYGVVEAIPAGANKAWGFLASQWNAFGQMFAGRINPKDSLGSLISIGQLYSGGWDWRRFWNLTAMLSVLLGFINLLPIPALDGGYVMFLLWEVITGKKPSDAVMEYTTMIGFFLLMILFVLTIGLDISRLF